MTVPGSRVSEKGVATLLITSMMLSVAMVFVLGSSGTTLYQVKRAQNTLFSRQAHWLAEGGLTCAFERLQTQLKTISKARPVRLMTLLPLDISFIACDQHTEGRQLTVQMTEVHGGRFQFRAASLVAGKAQVHLAHQAEVVICRSEHQSDCRLWSDGDVVETEEQLLLRWVSGTWHDF